MRTSSVNDEALQSVKMWIISISIWIDRIREGLCHEYNSSEMNLPSLFWEISIYTSLYQLPAIKRPKKSIVVLSLMRKYGRICNRSFLSIFEQFQNPSGKSQTIESGFWVIISLKIENSYFSNTPKIGHWNLNLLSFKSNAYFMYKTGFNSVTSLFSHFSLHIP